MYLETQQIMLNTYLGLYSCNSSSTSNKRVLRSFLSIKTSLNSPIVNLGRLGSDISTAILPYLLNLSSRTLKSSAVYKNERKSVVYFLWGQNKQKKGNADSKFICQQVGNCIFMESRHNTQISVQQIIQTKRLKCSKRFQNQKNGVTQNFYLVIILF